MNTELTEEAAAECRRLGIGPESQADDGLFASDGEFMALFYNFAYGEVLAEASVQLDRRTRSIAILAALLGAQAQEEFAVMLCAALNAGVSAAEIKEIIYQSAAYLGFAKTRPFLTAANEVLRQNGAALPLAAEQPAEAALHSADERRARGNAVQTAVFGEQMRENWKSAPPERRAVTAWLASNCFGDYYTRGGLDIRMRELITFCFLAAQGGCEAQLTSHAAGNMAVGNGAQFLVSAVHHILPYIGYPRSLNALACIDAARKK